MCIENPLDFLEDLGGGIRKINIITKLFRFANDVIKFNLLKSNSFVLLIVPEAYKLKEYDEIE